MTVAEIMKKMISNSDGNHHDINHLMKVWAFAKTIGELECLNPETQYILEVTAIIHDIACPFCREKYGEASGVLQEQESEPLVRAFLAGCGLTGEQTERIVYLVCHHHTYTNVDGLDYQILLEADYLVNADEAPFSAENIANVKERIFKTAAGKQLLSAVYGV